MKGYNIPHDDGDIGDEIGALNTWETLVVNSVGSVVEFWGFKLNQGRVWALLYMRDRPMTAAEVREELGLSKGAVSMILREVESWGVIHRSRIPGDSSWHFTAEIDLLKMIGRVFRDREINVVRRAKDDLSDALSIARRHGDVPDEILARLERMHQLAALTEHALDLFLKTARLDMTDVRGIFDDDDVEAP